MPNVLITGATGLLGPYLIEAAAALGRVSGVGQNWSNLRQDLSRPEAVSKLLDVAKPDVVINAIAATDVDECEANPEKADRINHHICVEFATQLPEDVPLVTISTDQVYPNQSGPHLETDAAPINIYGRSKFEGESATISRSRGLAFRTNFFGPSRTLGRSSLSDFFIDRFTKREPVTLFQDLLFSPLHMATLAEIIVDSVRHELTGVFNLGSRHGMSKCEFALAIADHLGLDSSMGIPSVSSAIAWRAPRTSDLRMNIKKIEAALGRQMPNLSEEIAKL